MTNTGDTQPDDQWADDETELMDDDSIFVDFDDEDEIPEERAEQPRAPVWRLIENLREEKLLRSAMADFEDYDEFENYAGL